jgi:hypothetical protein
MVCVPQRRVNKGRFHAGVCRIEGNDRSGVLEVGYVEAISKYLSMADRLPLTKPFGRKKEREREREREKNRRSWRRGWRRRRRRRRRKVEC